MPATKGGVQPAPLVAAPQQAEESDRGRVLPRKDVKNEGRSGDVYETKGHIDKMPGEKSDIYVEVI